MILLLDIQAELKFLRKNDHLGEPSLIYARQSEDHRLIAMYYCFQKAVDLANPLDGNMNMYIRDLNTTKEKLANRGYVF